MVNRNDYDPRLFVLVRSFSARYSHGMVKRLRGPTISTAPGRMRCTGFLIQPRRVINDEESFDRSNDFEAQV